MRSSVLRLHGCRVGNPAGELPPAELIGNGAKPQKGVEGNFPRTFLYEVKYNVLYFTYSL